MNIKRIKLIMILLICSTSLFSIDLINLYKEAHQKLTEDKTLSDLLIEHRLHKVNENLVLKVSDLVISCNLANEYSFHIDTRLKQINSKSDSSELVLFFSPLNNGILNFQVQKISLYLQKSKGIFYFKGGARIEGCIHVTENRLIIKYDFSFNKGVKTFSGPEIVAYSYPNLDSLLYWSKLSLLNNISCYNQAWIICRENISNYAILNHSDTGVSKEISLNSNFFLNRGKNVYFILLTYKDKEYLLAWHCINRKKYIYRLKGFAQNEQLLFQKKIFEKEEINKQIILEMFNDNYELFKIYLE